MNGFKYMNKSTETILNTKLVLASYNSVDSVVGSTRESLKGERTYYRPIANEYGTMYSDNLTIEYSLLKCNDKPFTYEEQRIIERWLTSPELSQWLEFYDDIETVKYFGKFIETEWVICHGGYSGVNFKFETNAPYPWKEEKHVFNLSGEGTHEIVFSCETDELEKPIYPVIKLTTSSTTTITIINNTDNENKAVIKMYDSLPLVIDCRNMIIKDATTSGIVNYKDLGWDVLENIYWFKIFSGNNIWTIDGEVNIEIIYNSVYKKVGGWL